MVYYREWKEQQQIFPEQTNLNMEVINIMAKSRLIGSYPVIGIRPTIDGRRGALDVRGSLEEQTMNMAKSAAKLLEFKIFQRRAG